jgi:hypothetical protein
MNRSVRAAWAGLAILVLLVAVASFRGLVERAMGAAACVERSKYEMISCLGPPDALAWTLTASVALLCAVALGMVIGPPRWLQERPGARMNPPASLAGRTTLPDAD